MNRVLLAIMDGVGVNPSRFGNAVALAKTPNLDYLKENALYRTLFAHGPYVGMPADSDLGNSEVGHNAMGAGRIFDQGAKLVKEAIASGRVFSGETWKTIIRQVNGSSKRTLHFIGLLSDGNVHSHEGHLFKMLEHAKQDGISKVRIHVLFDGRDVGEKTAEIYLKRLTDEMARLKKGGGFDVEVASGGGRMLVTMDRYEADWSIVERGWKAHVLGEAEYYFSSIEEALAFFRGKNITDQYIPAFVIRKNGQPVGPILNDDAVVFFNFRGDRAIEISRAFDEDEFSVFDRIRRPKVFYSGMMEYDGDLKIPKHYLVAPPMINDTMGQYLVEKKIRQFACSETQKFGHVTFFWNGNRSGYFDKDFEEYVDILSDRIEFDQAPAMKAKEIADVTIDRIKAKAFDFGRINFANGDMVGHTGNLKAAIIAMETVDHMIGRLVEACQKNDTILVVTADHGNCDEMFDAKEKDYPNWKPDSNDSPKPKTSHTTHPVPFYVFDPSEKNRFALVGGMENAGLANIANSLLVLMGLKPKAEYLPSVVKEV